MPKSKLKNFSRIVFFSISLLTTYYLLLTNVYAAGEFSPAYDVTYEVKETNKTIVTQNIHLINLTTNFYASEYTITFGTEKIEHITAWDKVGPLKMDVQKGRDLTKIHIVFNDKVVGKEKILNWTLRYESSEIAKKLGRIWEVNIPRAPADESTEEYNISLIVPSSFGQPAYIWPKPSMPYFWNIQTGSKTGISLAFGDWQGFRFNLNYHLENPYVIPGQTEISLPADSSYQEIILDKINPSPADITIDEDGNWLAQYYLSPKQKQDIRVSGYAKVFLTPRSEYQDKITNKMYQKYLDSQKFWEQDAAITEHAYNLKTPEAIYNFVVGKLSYNYQRAGGQANRLGAKQTLLTPDKAICMEFTDLFIALARAAGIPAREIDGYAYTGDSRLKPLSLVTDVLHSWPEYWDSQKGIWVQIDPTWGQTSKSDYFHRFDFSHLAFSIRGLSSTNPYPAGSYKNEKGSKDVLVEFVSEIPPKVKKSPILSILMPRVALAGLPLTGKVGFQNQNNQAFYNISLTINSSPINSDSKDIQFPILPPLAKKTAEIKFNNNNPFLLAKNFLKVGYGSQEEIVSFFVIPIPLVAFPVILALAATLFLLISVVKKIWMKFWLKR